MTRKTNAIAHAQWLLSGDPVKFELIVQHFQRPIFGFLTRMGLSARDTEDLAQDVFLQLWTARASYRVDKGSVSTWLWSIARNVALNRLTHLQHRQRYSSESESESDPAELAVSADKTTDPRFALETREQLRRVDGAIAQLSPPDRMVIALAFVDELSNAEAAKLCQCTEGAFRVRRTRARQRLLDILNVNHLTVSTNE